MFAADVPDPPGIPSVKAGEECGFVMKWPVPEQDGGSVVTEYIIEKHDPKSDKWVHYRTTRYGTMYVNVSPRI